MKLATEEQVEVELSLIACRGPASHEPAVSRQRSVRLLEHGSAHVLESDLDALLPGQHSGLGRDVLGRMIDDMMGAQGAGTLELLGTAGGGDDVGAEQASD